MRHGAAKERHFALAGQHHVRYVLTLAVQVAGVFLARDARAYALSGLAVFTTHTALLLFSAAALYAERSPCMPE